MAEAESQSRRIRSNAGFGYGLLRLLWDQLGCLRWNSLAREKLSSRSSSILILIVLSVKWVLMVCVVSIQLACRLAV